MSYSLVNFILQGTTWICVGSQHHDSQTSCTLQFRYSIKNLIPDMNHAVELLWRCCRLSQVTKFPSAISLCTYLHTAMHPSSLHMAQTVVLEMMVALTLQWPCRWLGIRFLLESEWSFILWLCFLVTQPISRFLSLFLFLFLLSTAMHFVSTTISISLLLFISWYHNISEKIDCIIHYSVILLGSYLDIISKAIGYLHV